HVQPRVEEMLMRRTAEAVGDHATPGIGLAGRDRGGLDDAGQLDLELDRAVLVEIPVKAVVVIADRREERDDEAPRAPHLESVVAEFIMLPEDAEILLMQADRVLHRGWLAEIVGCRHVEIMDVAETIAAELERVGKLAQAIFTGIERALPEMVRGWIGIGHDHVGDAGAIDDRAHLAAIAKRDLMQDQALTRGPAGAEGEVLPAHLPAIDREARARLLRDVERLDVLAHRGDRRTIVIARLFRDRDDLF